MHGNAYREPAWHSVVLDCKLVPLHKTCQSLPAVCYNNVHSVRLAVSPNAEIYGMGKTSPFSAISGPKFTKFGGLLGESVSFRLLISCSVVEIFSIKVQSRSQKAVFGPQPVGVNARGSSDQIFQTAVISEYVSKFG